MVEETLKKVGLKVTAPRLKILTLLHDRDSTEHLSADDLYQRLQLMGERISLATIYRVLSDLETANLLKRHCFEGETAVYELDCGDHHDHLVCVQCQDIVEFCDDVVESRLSDITAKSNFKIIDHTLTIYGICQQCQQA